MARPLVEEPRGRFDLKVDPAVRALIIEAAKLDGKTVSRFILEAAEAKAREVLADDAKVNEVLDRAAN